MAKPGSSPDNPDFYQPQDFAIGATIQAFKHRFIVMDADEYVLKFMENNSDEFPAEMRESLKEKHPNYKPEVKQT